MKKIFRTAGAIMLSFAFFASAEGQAQSIKDYKLFLDPGHSKKENQGLYNYSEAEKTLRVALAIRDYFYKYTDIDTVYMCRQTDSEQVELAGRTDMANALDVDFYYSIHSDAGAGSSNSTLTMYGGWKTNGVVIEKTPNGGKAFGDILEPNLTGVMKLSTRGNMADRTYYDASSDHTNKYAYLHVNRESNMASLLSEAGFHTNPYQQQRNLNAEYKRLEALAAFRSLLQYMGVTRPEIGLAVGEVKDSESGLAANGVTVTIGDKTYTTDSYESLFNKYSTDPEELRNGFYFIEGLTPGQEYDVTFSSPEFNTYSTKVTIPMGKSQATTPETIGWLDAQIVSSVPAKVKSLSAEDLSNVIKENPLTITFSRKMDRTSVQSAISIAPSKPLTYTWKDDYTLQIDLTALDYQAAYTLKIDASVAKNSQTNQFLDGDANGTDGGNYELAFTTAIQDNQAPVVVSFDPASDGVVTSKRPFIRIQYDEALDVASIAADQVVVKTDAKSIAGTIKPYTVNKKTVIHLYLTEDLEDNTSYNLEVKGGVKDLFGNAAVAWTSKFNTVFNIVSEEKMLDAFETYADWWQPSASGSTSGLDAASLALGSTSVTASPTSVGSAQFNYVWEYTSGKARFVRWYVPAATSKSKGTFDNTYVLKVDLFGDASGNKFRFNLVDGSGKYEATKDWVVMDWIGWKTVEWDLTKGEAVAWVNGNGVLDPGNPYYIDSFQFADADGSASSGTIYLDNFRVVKEVTGSSIENDEAEAGISIDSSNGAINIEAASTIKSIVVYALNGSVIKNIKTDSDSYKIEGLTKGFYIVKVDAGSAQVVEKVILR